MVMEDREEDKQLTPQSKSGMMDEFDILIHEIYWTSNSREKLEAKEETLPTWGVFMAK